MAWCAGIPEYLPAGCSVGSGGPIWLVSGPSAFAGALAPKLAHRPMVLIDGRYDRSPWVNPQLARRCGVLELQYGGPYPGWTLTGPAFPDLWWRVVPPDGWHNGSGR